MVVGHDPLVAVGKGTYLDELLTLAHGENIGEASGQTWPRLSLEYLMAVGPQMILDGQMGSERSVPSSFWARYPAIPAVRDDRVRGYPIDLMLHPGPRIAHALEMIARLIHPEAFSAVLRNRTARAGAAWPIGIGANCRERSPRPPVQARALI